LLGLWAGRRVGARVPQRAALPRGRLVVRPSLPAKAAHGRKLHRCRTLKTKEQHMKRRKLLRLAFATALALSSLVATAAQATQGPFFKVEGNTLKAGETREALVTVKEQFVLEAKATGQVITCKGVTYAGPSFEVLASKVTHLRASALEFSSCTVTGNGTKCAVQSGKITTNPVVGTAGYANSNRTGQILGLIESQTGKAFGEIKFTPEAGGSCTVASTPASGTIIGEAFVAGKTVKVGENEIETIKGEIHYTKPSKVIWIENGITVKETKGKLEAFGVAVTIAGQVNVELTTHEKWGIFT
jgi:hypothetical protein